MSETSGLTWHDLVSSNLRAVAYSDTDNVLYIKFRDGGIYAYDNADPILFNNLIDAGSPGGYFAANIRDLPTRKLT